MWRNIFHLDLTVAEKVLRAALVYAFLVIALRFAGKRELAQVNTLDFIVLMAVANAVQNGIIGDDNSVTGGIIGATALLVVNYLVVRFLYRHERLERLVEGDPDVLIENGKVLTDRLAEELITLPELESAAHKQGFASLDDVDRAVLEPGGTISFFAKKPTAESARHEEVLRRLDELSTALRGLGVRPAG